MRLSERFADIDHLLRVAGLFGAGVVVFLVVRALLVPSDFGVYGHYRAKALEELSARAPFYAGQKACAECHGDVVKLRGGGPRAGVACEACHGPLSRHAADPAAVKPGRPDPAVLCLVCHAKNVAKPAAFPQVDAREHAADAPCDACHTPHQPKVQ